MKRVLLNLLAGAIGMTASLVYAADDTGAFYVSPMALWSILDKQRDVYDDVGFQVGLGKNLTPNWAAELSVGSANYDNNHGSKLKLSQYGVDVLYKFFPDSNIKPYLLAGVGGLDDKLTNVPRTSAFEGEAGVGVLWGFGNQTKSTRLLLRTEAKYRKEYANNAYGASDPGDVLFGLGLQFEWGAPVPAAAAMLAAPLDSDGDGVPDDRDHCPGTPAGAKVDANGCEFDSDGDGVVDRLDQCPDTPKGTPVNAVGCPLDSDGDGVPDTLDLCPNTPKGDKVDVHGCTLTGEIKLPGVTFNTDSAVLLPESESILNDAVATLKKYPLFLVEVGGFTDNRGTAKHNLLLSQRRAESVEAYLKSHGVTNDLSAQGYGKNSPIADNRTEEGRLANRRVTLKLKEGPGQ